MHLPYRSITTAEECRREPVRRSSHNTGKVDLVSGSGLYQRLGRHAGTAAIVDDFYRRVLADADLQRHFAGVSMPIQRRHMTAFLISAVGGPDTYRGRDLNSAHEGLAVTGSDFDGIAELLAQSLREHAVAEEDVATVLTRIGSLRSQIVGVDGQWIRRH
ncbi:group I truncated hemoglobin [Amycolatopsis cihanbeyliensis]|uniref:group I truncated hemoglobin n=1 Tax=Amycolatopsis cihanbeyliensis TaxID=1128664 RepID=UPI001FEBD956|nr:group 1 truncated hemoglobin [Amycolatopsis cihanbeyliensis]